MRWLPMLAALLACSPVVATNGAAQDVPPERLFRSNCSACHQRDGRGIPQAFPALDGDALVQGEPRALVAVLLNGRGGMPSFRRNSCCLSPAGMVPAHRP